MKIKTHLQLIAGIAAGMLSLQAQAVDQQEAAQITNEVAAGTGAKLACSGVFLQKRAPDHVVKRDLRPIAYPLVKDVQFSFDHEAKIATGTAGNVKRSALYRPGVGCTLMLGDATVEQLLAQAEDIEPYSKTFRAQEWPEGDVVSLKRANKDVDWQALDAAVDAAFVDTSEHQTIDTRAMLVVHNGEIIAEKYADGFDHNSLFLSWSASKSMASTLIGTMVTDNKLALNEAPFIPEWTANDDPRRKITLRHLLDMTSGLAFSEPYVPGSDSTTMLFREGDMAKYAASKPAEVAPDTKWYYSSGTTNILSRILRHMAGGTLKDVHTYSWNRFFEPVGMTSAIFEPDVSGSHVGSSYFYATAQDWARFGLLYLNEGRVGDQQILSKEWVKYAQTSTPASPLGKYGAQFWQNPEHPVEGGDHQLPDAPKDLFFANGYSGQHVAIVPSKNAVVIRFGWANRGEEFDLNKHFSAILDALPDK